MRFVVLGAVAFVLLPTPPAEQQPQGSVATPVANLETHEILSAAIGTVADVASFCGRQPQTCEAMASIASVAEAKAKYSFKLAYEWANGGARKAAPDASAADTGISGLLDQRDSDEPERTQLPAEMKQSLTDPMITGSTVKFAGAEDGTNTLRIDDLIPDWRGPEPARQS